MNLKKVGMRLFLGTILLEVALWGQGAGGVQFRDWPAPGVSAKPTIECGELRSLTGFDLSIMSASMVQGVPDTPEHCRVSVLVQPEINVEVNLPSTWNKRLYMFGNGGWAGESFEAPNRAATRSRGLKYGFMTAATDTGHSAVSDRGAAFALNRQKLVDFGFRSLHVTAEVAKRLARSYYGERPLKSYFDGCSQGGRQGLILAQRFPSDFDGILVGAPALYNTGLLLARAWWSRILANEPVPFSKLKMLADRIYGQCDSKDGLKDGLIDDPRRCGFLPGSDLPRCAGGTDKSDCFMPAEIATLERIYGDVLSRGKRFFPGWPVGSEIAGHDGKSGWTGQVVSSPAGPAAWATFTEDFLRFLVFPEKSSEYSLSRFDIDQDPQRTLAIGQILDATDTGLSAFERRGGKIVMYFGWADPRVNPLMGVEYYEKVVERMGRSTGDFFRLFMVPGMFHCGGGVGTGVFDAATPLLNWVESGNAPDRITASRVADSKVVRTRPLCAYPLVARYKGSGSIDDAANFTCVKP